MTLILVRGLPGSGKSTIAKSFIGFEHYEADMYHMVRGEYCYDQDRAVSAHAWCQSKTLEALSNGKNVVVSNTFVTNKEMQPYINICESLGIVPTIIEAKGNYQNDHNVPDEVLQLMMDRWEPNQYDF